MIPNLQEELNEFMVVGRRLGLVGTQFDADASGPGGKFLVEGGKKILDCTRLDYLGIGEDLKIKLLMHQAIAKYDIAPPASQIVTKPAPLAELERTTAAWQGLSKSWIFTSGYTVNVNLMQALGLRFRSPHLAALMKSREIGQKTKDMKTFFFYDKYSHFSMMQGIKSSVALEPDHVSAFRFDCEKPETLEALLEERKELLKENVGIIVSDTLVSGNGQVVDVKALYRMAEKYNCYLYLDEAHSVGCMGPHGRGLAAEMIDGPDVDKERIIVMGTFTKTFAQLGGFVALGNEEMAHMVRICSPQYVFSGPLQPWVAQVLTDTINLFSSPWGAQKRQSLADKAAWLRSEVNKLGFDTLGSTSHIVPVLVGDEAKCLFLQQKLREKGFHVASFYYPAVVKGKAILRFSVCDDMSYDELSAFLVAFKAVLAGHHHVA